MVHPAGRDVAGRHRVDAHSGVRPFGRCGLGQAHHPGPRRPAVPHRRHRAPDVGDDVDDRATMLAHRLPIAFARHQEAAGQVGPDHRIPALGADRFQRRDELAAGIVHQRVDPAVHQHDRLHRVLHRLFVADVAGMEGGAPAVGGDLAGHVVQLVELAADQHHLGAERGQFMRGAAADARTAAGDQDHFLPEQARGEDRAVAIGGCHGESPAEGGKEAAAPAGRRHPAGRMRGRRRKDLSKCLYF